MPSLTATCRASLKASKPQQLVSLPRLPPTSSKAYVFMVIPITAWPRSCKSAAATDESTPPLMPTTTVGVGIIFRVFPSRFSLITDEKYEKRNFEPNVMLYRVRNLNILDG